MKRLILTPFTLCHSLLAAYTKILMIAVDDLRPQLCCYGEEQVHSPNIDRLASQSLHFNRAYGMVPACYTITKPIPAKM